MLIHVHYADNGFDYVDKKMLQTLIDSKKIIGFMRSSGWVDINKDPIRKSLRKPDYVPPATEHHHILRVEYENHQFDYVKDTVLDQLLDSNKIKKFERNNGWVTVGVDPLRKMKREKIN